jgi:gentisate 1,2-dioxygenase
MDQKTVRTPVAGANIKAVREDFYNRIAPDSLAPLWDRLHNLVTETPQPKTKAHRWRYADVRPYLMEACELITAEEAERRVLILENPGLAGQSRATASLFAGLQVILPGEIAPPHRHTQTALRFVIEGEGAYTAVDGERTEMHEGDFIITPSWTWHDHGNPSSKPMVWLDGLDIPMVEMFGASFRQGDDGDEARRISKPEDDSHLRYGNGVAPLAHDHRSQTSPLFNYPYARTRETLAEMAKTAAPDSHMGHAVKYTNPLTGDYAIPTIATHMTLFQAGFEANPYRSTDSTVFVCMEGKGATTIAGEVFDWGPRDVLVVPSWAQHTHKAEKESVLFSYSDRGVQQKLGLWREARG